MTTGLILGSGWPLPTGLVINDTLPLSAVYAHSSTQPVAEVQGHNPQVYIGTIDQHRVIVVGGRRHLYQGLSAHYITQPFRWMQAQGVKRVVLTNASGGINPGFAAGDVMLIADHLNLTGHNPLSATAPDQPVTFMDTSRMYCPDWLEQAKALLTGLTLHTGVYAGVLGPSYETPAEVRMLARLGADAVGMSTVLEALQACALGMPVLGLSLISNAAAGLAATPLSHADVLAQVQARQGILADGLAHTITT